jgi:hypothetical protein
VSLAATDHAVTQPQPGSQLPARFSVAQFDAMIDIPHRSLMVHLDPVEGRYRSVQTFGEHELVNSKSVTDVSLSVSRLFR